MAKKTATLEKEEAKEEILEAEKVSTIENDLAEAQAKIKKLENNAKESEPAPTTVLVPKITPGKITEFIPIHE